MSKVTWSEVRSRFGFKQWFLLILNVVLVLACGASLIGLHFVTHTPDTISAARQFRGESETRFAQLACYMSVGQGKAEEDIFSFRQTLDSKLTEQSLEVPENGSLYVDAYSGSANVTIRTDYGTATLNAVGVGGDFFTFHPLKLRSGTYIHERDLMDDLVILDELLAWRLYGGVDLAGMTVYINEVPFVVAGVVSMEDDFASEKARTQEGALFMSWTALKRLDEDLTIDCYEIVLPDPITGYAYGVVQDSFSVGDGEIVENSGRYDMKNLLGVIGSFGDRSMRTNGVIYPYWENALRLVEDYAVLLLILAVVFAVCPAVFILVFAVRYIRKGYRGAKKAIPEKVEAAVERRREAAYERENERV